MSQVEALEAVPIAVKKDGNWKETGDGIQNRRCKDLFKSFCFLNSSV